MAGVYFDPFGARSQGEYYRSEGGEDAPFDNFSYPNDFESLPHAETPHFLTLRKNKNMGAISALVRQPVEDQFSDSRSPSLIRDVTDQKEDGLTHPGYTEDTGMKDGNGETSVGTEEFSSQVDEDSGEEDMTVDDLTLADENASESDVTTDDLQDPGYARDIPPYPENWDTMTSDEKSNWSFANIPGYTEEARLPAPAGSFPWLWVGAGAVLLYFLLKK